MECVNVSKISIENISNEGNARGHPRSIEELEAVFSDKIACKLQLAKTGVVFGMGMLGTCSETHGFTITAKHAENLSEAAGEAFGIPKGKGSQEMRDLAVSEAGRISSGNPSKCAEALMRGDRIINIVTDETMRGVFEGSRWSAPIDYNNTLSFFRTAYRIVEEGFLSSRFNFIVDKLIASKRLPKNVRSMSEETPERLLCHVIAALVLMSNMKVYRVVGAHHLRLDMTLQGIGNMIIRRNKLKGADSGDVVILHVGDGVGHRIMDVDGNRKRHHVTVPSDQPEVMESAISLLETVCRGKPVVAYTNANKRGAERIGYRLNAHVVSYKTEFDLEELLEHGAGTGIDIEKTLAMMRFYEMKHKLRLEDKGYRESLIGRMHEAVFQTVVRSLEDEVRNMDALSM